MILSGENLHTVHSKVVFYAHKLPDFCELSNSLYTRAYLYFMLSSTYQTMFTDSTSVFKVTNHLPSSVLLSFSAFYVMLGLLLPLINPIKEDNCQLQTKEDYTFVS